MTASALVEYQVSAGISPATGYYGPLTRAYMESGKTTVTKTVTPTSPTTTTSTGTSASTGVPTIDLTLGAKGSEVVWLQTFLIEEASGPEATSLSTAGATGYFGTVTKAALSEYQSKNGITPASGYFGPLTRVEVSKS
jgi:peptidoglycan hydrolase-like protein with peptidoglycan-binding domain